MIPFYILGLLFNILAFHIWYCTRTKESEYQEREPINLVLFIFMIIFAFCPIVNFILGAAYLIWYLFEFNTILGSGSEYLGPIRFKMPKWLRKTIK